jgi:hypothetical protein
LKQVECATHGASSGALVCRHLHEGEQLGFHYFAAREPDELECPDAWCDDCHAVLDGADDWTDEFVEHAGFQVVCSQCYGIIRANNWVQDDEAWEELLASSVAFLEEQQRILTRDFKLGDHERWDYDQDRGQLTFSNQGKVALICDILFVGSFSKVTGTWLWSWANESVEEKLKAPLLELCEFGEEQGFERLAGAYWEAAEEDAWEMTAVAARFLGAIGAYRAPKDRGFTFMVITGARWAQ